MNSTKTLLRTLTLVLAVAMIIGCEPEKTPTPTTPPPPQPTAGEGAAALPPNLFLDKAPDNPVELAAAKKTAKPGDTITIRGRVAGHPDPLAPNRAIITLLDSSVKTCNQMPGDSCPTPWDACCEPRESLQASTATVQVVDATGKPVKTTLRGIENIEPLKELLVVGKVKDAGGSGTLVIDATGIYVKG